MADTTLIAWADRTFNPWLGCTKVSAGCDHCYAETLTKNRMGLDVWGPDANRQITSVGNWRKPVQWNRKAEAAGSRLRVFCGSLCDWAEKKPELDEPRERQFALIRATPWLDWMLLTKRTGRIARCLPDDWGDGYPNVWIGTSIESNEVAYRGRQLRAIPAIVRFVSYEPAVGPLDELDLEGLHWMIFGGESGPGYREMDVQWARYMRTRCEANGTAFFYKQSAAYRTEMGIELDGEIVRHFPLDRSPRGFEPTTVTTRRPTSDRQLPMAL